jgi:hypothetical protein
VIEATRRKLDEARFFHQHLLQERQGRGRMHDPRAFRYYFSAFIQAARNVTWALGKEEQAKWKEWEPTWRGTLNDEERKFLDLTNKLRVDEVHRGGADMSVEWEEVALHELFSDTGLHPAYTMVMRRAYLGAPPPRTMRPTYYLEDENGKQEVTALCERYMKFLEKALSDFEQGYQSQ